MCYFTYISIVYIILLLDYLSLCHIVSMTPPLTHQQCREEMCCACGGKAGKNKVTPALGALVRKWAQPSWSPEVMSYPCGICETCRRRLNFHEKNESPDLPHRLGAEIHWVNFQLEEISVPRGQLASDCVCKICVARKTNVVYHKGFNNRRKAKKQIYTSNSMEDVPPVNVSKPCSTCYQKETGCGIPHPCTESARKRNLAALVLDVNDKGKEQIAAKVLKI